MAETTPTTTLNPGAETSEFKVTKYVMIASYVVAICGGIAETLTQMTNVLPNAKWIGVALTVVGLISGAAAQVGYALSRGMVKAGHAITLPPPNPAAQAAQNLDK